MNPSTPKAIACTNAGGCLRTSTSPNSAPSSADCSSDGTPLAFVRPALASPKAVPIASSNRGSGGSSSSRTSTGAPLAFHQSCQTPGGTVSESPTPSVRRRPPTLVASSPASTWKRSWSAGCRCSPDTAPSGRTRRCTSIGLSGASSSPRSTTARSPVTSLTYRSPHRATSFLQGRCRPRRRRRDEYSGTSVVAPATPAVVVAAVVVFGTVVVSAAARALDLDGDPAPARAAHGGLDVAQAGAQAGE